MKKKTKNKKTQNDEKYSVWYYLSTLLKDLALLGKQTEDVVILFKWFCLEKDIILGHSKFATCSSMKNAQIRFLFLNLIDYPVSQWQM